MDAVALAATIGGSFVAISAVAGNVLIARTQRRQAVELAEKQQQHERHLSRGERLFDRRAPIYEAMMRVVQPAIEHVEARLPIITFGEPPELPPEPTLDEQRELQIKLRSLGSLEVADAYADFVRRVHTFHVLASMFERAQGQGGDIAGQRQRLDEARQQARDAEKELDRLVSEELGSL